VATIRIVEGDRIENGGPGPGPTSRRYESRRSLPRAVLKFRGPGEATRRLPLDRVLTLVGGSERCHVRLPGSGISRFVCGLLRTPAGVWVVDLLSSRGVAINNVFRRATRLEDGDVLRIGTLTFRLTYGAPTTPLRSVPPAQPAGSVFGAGLDRPGLGPLPPALIDPPEVLFSEAALRPLLEGGGAEP
jgi:FHA domain